MEVSIKRWKGPPPPPEQEPKTPTHDWNFTIAMTDEEAARIKNWVGGTNSDGLAAACNNHYGVGSEEVNTAMELFYGMYTTFKYRAHGQ